MSNPAIDRESEPLRGPTRADLQADYDDEFGRVRTPRQIARRRLLIPAIDFLFLGICSALFSIGSAIYVVYDYIGDAVDPMEYLEMVGLLTLCMLGGALAALIIVAGDGMLRLRHHRVALIASYIVTSLSLASLYAILFYPFGIWALVLLYKTEVRNEFDRVVDPSESTFHDRRKSGGKRSKRRNPPLLLLAIGAFGLLIVFMLVLALFTSSNWDNAWDAEENFILLGLALFGTIGFGFVLFRGIQLYRRFPFDDKSDSPSEARRQPEPE